MTKIIAALFAFLLAAPAFAHEDMEMPEDVMSMIMSRQGVSAAGNIDCNAVADADFEMLGDAVMGRMAGSHELHERMDAAMGGEGSASLRNMHAAMGRNWLGCGQGTAGMMDANMMPMMMRMMGSFYPAYYSGYDIVLAAGLAGWILFGAALYCCLRKKPRRR